MREILTQLATDIEQNLMAMKHQGITEQGIDEVLASLAKIKHILSHQQSTELDLDLFDSIDDGTADGD